MSTFAVVLNVHFIFDSRQVVFGVVFEKDESKNLNGILLDNGKTQHPILNDYCDFWPIYYKQDKRFKEGCKDIKDDDCPGRARTSTTDNVEQKKMKNL